jgi:adenosine kinase
MAVLCTGSIAIDHIMVFPGRFKDVILPDKIHVLNVAFHVPEMRRSFGGTAANVAFNLRLLGEDPILLGTVGRDFDDYAAWLDRHGIRRRFLRQLSDEATAGCYITTDLDDNQITGFHPGAMDRAHEAPISEVDEPVEIAIVSPNGKQAMVQHARDLKARGVPVVIDPGQGLPLFERDELVELLDGADTYVVNDYEWSLTQSTSGLSEDEVAARVEHLVITRGAEGSVLRTGDARREIPAAPAREVVDPTGCGDAWRAGYLFGRRRKLPVETCGRLGSLMGSLAVERRGTQSLDFGFDEFEQRFAREFGDRL